MQIHKELDVQTQGLEFGPEHLREIKPSMVIVISVVGKSERETSRYPGAHWLVSLTYLGNFRPVRAPF